MTGENPLLPAAYDIVWTCGSVIALVLLVWALVRWFRIRSHSNSVLTDLVTIAAFVIFPLIGPAAYLIATWNRRRTGATTAPANASTV
ncbi:hypothetical protein [Brevibacterium litoralis]|uniref:hypothetical protein n=1 Tax=Brevibacterium litoralis TaxID=3138935 RepID=UPI0032EEB811